MNAQQLKNSILQMAIQGKLVPQDPTDEPASVLLERIRKEKEQLIKAGKIKRDKHESVICRKDNSYYETVDGVERCIDDEVPFDIPDSWEWIRIKSCTQLYNGKAFKPSDWTKEGLPIVRIQNLNDPSAPFNHFKGMLEPEFTLYGGELLFAWSASFGAYIWKEEKAALNQHIYKLEFNENLIYKLYYMYVLNQMTKGIMGVAHGTGMQHVTKGVFENTLIPLPPISEQKRITGKIEELLPFIEKYGESELLLSKAQMDFPNQLKKSILQLAVQGKLVAQDPTDELASVLLERIHKDKEQLIKAGKIKRDKHESVICRKGNSYYETVDGVERCIDYEIPFDIPDNWEWCRFKAFLNIVSARRVHQSDWRSKGIPFYRSREIAKLAEDGYVDNQLFISPELYEEYAKSGVPTAGDLMVTAVGTLGKTYIVKPSDRFYYKDASVLCFENFGKINSSFLRIIMQSPFMESAIKEGSSGTTVGTITIIRANEYLVPLPPLAEQQRIVEKVEEVLPLLKSL